MQRALRRAAWLDVLRLAERVLDQNIQSEPAHLALAHAFDQMGLLNHATWVVEQADAVCDTRLKIQEALSDLYNRRGSFTQAQEVAKPRSDLDDKTFAREQELELAIEQNPNDPVAYLQLAKLLSETGRGLRAGEKLTQGLAATRNDFEIAVALQELDVDVFRRDLAIAVTRLQDAPYNQELLALRSTLERELLAREIAMWRMRAERNPGDSSHRMELGIRLLKSGQFDEALDTLLSVRADPKCGGRALLYAAYCHVNRRQLSKAAPLLREALTMFSPNDEGSKKEALYLLAGYAAEAANWKEALALGDELTGIDQDYRDIGLLLAQWRKPAAS
jgi:tetratricopeptide (TPR) repeat protein